MLAIVRLSIRSVFATRMEISEGAPDLVGNDDYLAAAIMFAISE